MASDKKRANILNLVEAAWGRDVPVMKSPSASDVGGGVAAGSKSTAYRKTSGIPSRPPYRRPQIVHDSIKKIINWTLEFLNMDSPEARELIFKTGMAESKYKALEQYGDGPAVGYFQVEPATINDTIDNYVAYRQTIQTKLWNLGFDDKDSVLRVMGNIPLQVAFCRLKYRRDKYALPKCGDLEAQAKYWKRVYNSHLGKGTVKHFMEANKDV